MNYRHAFHAGSFADVHKHCVLVRALLHLRLKPGGFRVIDTHAGAGRYDLQGPEPRRSGEWHGGIERVWRTRDGEATDEVLQPYLDIIAALNPDGELRYYPGSPLIVQSLLRPQDRLIACELEPKAFAALAHNLARDRRIKTVAVDGWVALNAYVPPPERRGVVVIDPSFEDARDFDRLALGLEGAHRKWASGIYLIWYPVKGRQGPDALARRLKRSGIARILRAELAVGATPAEGPLGGCGLIAINPPWTLAAELAAILPELATILGGHGGSHRLNWIVGESS
jgi:23S rRNA (adenine2030-N6)-methyltransferase